MPTVAVVQPPDFEALFEAATTPCLVLSTDFVVVTANAAYLRAARRERQELVGRNIFELFPDNPDDPAANGVANLTASLRRVLETKAPDTMAVQKYDIAVPGPEGMKYEERYWNPRNTPLLDAGGQVTHFIHNVEDVTDFVRATSRADRMEATIASQALDIQAANRRLAEANASLEQRVAARAQAQEAAQAQLRESEQRFRLLADSIPQIVWVVDAAGQAVYFNRQWSAYTGVPVDATTPEQVSAGFVHPDDHAITMRAWEAALATGSVFTVEHRIRSASGMYRWFLVRAEPVRGADGRITQWFGTSTDVHDRKLAEVALRRSEERYRSLFTSIDEGFCVVEVLFDDGGTPCDYRFVEVNPSFEQQTGVVAATGKTARELAPDLESHWFEVYGRVARTGEPTRFQSEAKAMQRWFDVFAFRVEDGDGPKVAILFNDITERKREERRRAFLLRLADELGPLGDPAAIEGKAAELLRAELAAAWCFYAEYEDDGRTAVIHHDAVRPGLPSLAGRHDLSDLPEYVEVVRQGEMIDVPDFAQYGLFSRRVVERYAPIGVRSMLGLPLVKNGRLVAQLSLHDTQPRAWSQDDHALVRDVAERTWSATERARAEQLLAGELTKQREAEQRKDEFLAVLGHELRNPLAPISTGLHLLDRARQNPGLLDSVVPMMHRQVAHLTRLVSDLLDISRVSRGRVELRRAPLDLNDAVESAVEQVQSLVTSSRHGLVLSLSQHPLRLQADVERLTQVIANLLTNAAKYTNPGGTIEITTTADKHDAVLRVADTGFGIPSERLEDIFEMFVQVPEHRQLDGGAGGLGIGLALARQLVSMHGGTIEARSSGLGQGSQFVVRLPLAQEASDSPPVPEARGEMRTRRILVVDDNVDAALSLSALLELSGHEVRTEHDGPGALRRLATFDAQVVLLDIGMPGMDGLQVAHHIRRQPRGEHPLLVAVSGWGQELDRRRCEEAGFDHHLTKPADTAELLSLVQRSRAVGQGS